MTSALTSAFISAPIPAPTQENIPALRARLQREGLSHQDGVQSVLQAAQAPEAASVFTRLYAQEALAAAKLADSKPAGQTPLPLAGLPITIKDLYDVAGEATWAGSVVCQNEAPAPVDAVAVQRLRQAGAVLIGKTNMSEFAFSGVGLNPHFGTPRNPADPEVARIPGGSSSGAAVSVALGLAVAALGSDTGGSIRIPAALCGLVGFKSSQFRVPLTGAFPLAPSVDTVCAMTRSVADCALVDGVLAGQALAIENRPLKGMRLALPQAVVLEDMDPTVAKAYERALRTLAAAGAVLVELPLQELAEVAEMNTPFGLSPIEAYRIHAERLRSQADRIDARVVQRIRMGEGASPADYQSLLSRRQDWIGRMASALRGFDAVLCPTVPLVAAPMATVLAAHEAFFKVNGLLLRNTALFNFMDGCSISLPCHSTGELPVGLMLSAARGQDAHLLSVATAVEQALTLGQAKAG